MNWIASRADESRTLPHTIDRQQRGYYQDDAASHVAFANYDVAGSLDVDATLMAASPEIVSFTIGSGFYQAGMARPNSDDDRAFTWSRKLYRVLTEQDVFARKPDRALRRLALARFDNRDNIQTPDDPDGIPLAWDRATIGRTGITWWYSPYELGGYLSGGGTTLTWPSSNPICAPSCRSRFRPSVMRATSRSNAAPTDLCRQTTRPCQLCPLPRRVNFRRSEQ